MSNPLFHALINNGKSQFFPPLFNPAAQEVNPLANLSEGELRQILRDALRNVVLEGSHSPLISTAAMFQAREWVKEFLISLSAPGAVRDNDRPVYWVIGQQILSEEWAVLQNELATSAAQEAKAQQAQNNASPAAHGAKSVPVVDAADRKSRDAISDALGGMMKAHDEGRQAFEQGLTRLACPFSSSIADGLGLPEYWPYLQSAWHEGWSRGEIEQELQDAKDGYQGSVAKRGTCVFYLDMALQIMDLFESLGDELCRLPFGPSVTSSGPTFPVNRSVLAAIHRALVPAFNEKAVFPTREGMDDILNGPSVRSATPKPHSVKSGDCGCHGSEKAQTHKTLKGNREQVSVKASVSDVLGSKDFQNRVESKLDVIAHNTNFVVNNMNPASRTAGDMALQNALAATQ